MNIKTALKQSKWAPTFRRIKDWGYGVIWLLRHRRGAAPRFVKIGTLRSYAKKFQCSTLVESGTFLGDTIASLRATFTSVYSIELDEVLYARAVARFARYPSVHLLRGDSGIVIEDVIPHLAGPALFWLDGHYSGGITAQGALDTPVMSELGHIFAARRPNDVILIDDARMFVGKDGYPTLSELSDYARKHGFSLEVSNDIIRLIPSI